MRTIHLAALLLAGAALGRLDAEPIHVRFSPPSRSEPLTSTIVAWESLAGAPTGVGFLRPVFDNPATALLKLEMHVTTLLPGKTSHNPHEHPWEEMLYMKEGSIEVSINGQPKVAGPGDLVFFASRDPHNATNRGTIPATYYAINFMSDRVTKMVENSAAEQQVAGALASGVYPCTGPGKATDTGSRLDVVDSPTLTYRRLSIHATTLAVGQRTAPNMVDEGNELFIIQEGLLQVSIDGVVSRLAPGAFFYCEPNAKRSLANIGSSKATYLVIKVLSDRSPSRAQAVAGPRASGG
jgi:XRE family transcriptional regulator, regulator of sulfur utilization